MIADNKIQYIDRLNYTDEQKKRNSIFVCLFVV